MCLSNKKELARLQNVQNSAARVLIRTNRKTYITPFLKCLLFFTTKCFSPSDSVSAAETNLYILVYLYFRFIFIPVLVIFVFYLIFFFNVCKALCDRCL